jgi:type II secretory pathway pseudopilin PulG
MFRTPSYSEPRSIVRTEGSPEDGFTLAALIVILTVMSIIIAYTVPKQWSVVMKRERERQTIFLMKQYARGILNWRTKHNNTAPVSLDQLREARNPRLIRGSGKWPCPLTGNEDDWILVPPGAIQPGGAGQTQSPPIIGGPGYQANQPQTGGQPSKLNPEASPKDYVGPFVGVRPNAKGKSLVSLNGAEDYSEWVYTVDDLVNEIQVKQQALATMSGSGG